MGGTSGLDSALLVERELFAQEEILGCERAFRSQTENQKAEQISKEVQPKQAEFHHGRMSFVFGLLLQIGQFSAFQVTPIIFAEDSTVRRFPKGCGERERSSTVVFTTTKRFEE